MWISDVFPSWDYVETSTDEPLSVNDALCIFALQAFFNEIDAQFWRDMYWSQMKRDMRKSDEETTKPS